MRLESLPAEVRKNIIRLYIIKTAKWFMLVMPVIVPFYEFNGLDLQDIMTLKSVYSLSVVLFEIPSGYLADRLGRKNTLIAGAILGTAGYVVYSVSFGFTGFLVAELVLGAGLSMVSGADSALLYDTLSHHNHEKDYTMYEGRVTSVGNFAESAAGLLGGLLALVSLRYPFYAQTVVAFTAIPAALTLWEPARENSGSFVRFRDILLVVRTCFISDPRLRINILFSSIIGAATLSMAWFVQPYFEFTGIPLSMFGVLWTALNIFLGVVSAFAYRLEHYFGQKRILIIITLIIPLGFIVTALIGSVWGLAVIFLFYIVRGMATPVLKDYINRLTRSEIRATVLSVRNFSIRIIFAIMAPFAGMLSDRSDIRTGLMVSGLIFTIILIPLLLVYLRQIANSSEKK